MMLSRLSLFLLLLVTISCGKSLPEISDVDLDSFSKDKNACGQYRTSVIQTLDSQKDKLLALDERQIVELLGSPDRNELYKRNQKFYYYYLKPSPECNSTTAPLRLAIRFNAMGLAKEVMLE